MTFPIKVFVAIYNLGQSDSQYGAVEITKLEVSCLAFVVHFLL